MIRVNASLNNNSGPADHYYHISRLSGNKALVQKRLDKRLGFAFKHCGSDKTSKICKIFWDDVDECLEEIDVMNQEIRFHTWNLLMNEHDL